MKYFRSMLRLFLIVVFIGYIMVWSIMPTNAFYLHWLPHIVAKTDSTYIGKQGFYFFNVMITKDITLTLFLFGGSLLSSFLTKAINYFNGAYRMVQLSLVKS